MLAPINRLFSLSQRTFSFDDIPENEIAESINKEFGILLQPLYQDGGANYYIKALKDIAFLLVTHNEKADSYLQSLPPLLNREQARRNIVNFHMGICCNLYIFCHDAAELGIILTNEQANEILEYDFWRWLNRRFNLLLDNSILAGSTPPPPGPHLELPPTHFESGETKEALRQNEWIKTRIKNIMETACKWGFFKRDKKKYTFKPTRENTKKDLAFFCMCLYNHSPIENAENEEIDKYGTIYENYFGIEKLTDAMNQIKHEHKKRKLDSPKHKEQILQYFHIY